ncbi:hypothetical protein [Blastococcus sp. SYSU DS0617]
MSERNGSTSTGPGTAEIPVVRPGGAVAASKTGAAPKGGAAAKAGAASKTAAAPKAGAAPKTDAAATTGVLPTVAAPDAVTAEAPPEPEPAGTDRDLPPGAQPTAPVSVRPAPRMPRRGPMTIMGPWAPVAGGLLGLVLGGIVAAILAGSAESYDERLSVVFVVLGLSMLGTAGTLLADEVRIVRQQARDAVVRPQWVEATAGLVNGLTPARLLMLGSVVVLVLAAYVGRG